MELYVVAAAADLIALVAVKARPKWTVLPQHVPVVYKVVEPLCISIRLIRNTHSKQNKARAISANSGCLEKVMKVSRKF